MSTPDAQTVTVLEGAERVAATDYGNAITYTPEDRATRAFDGDVHTAWRTGEFDDVRGDRIRIVLDHAITTDHVNLVQVLDTPNDRFITRALVRFDGGATRTGRPRSGEPDRRRADDHVPDAPVPLLRDRGAGHERRGPRRSSAV